MSIKEEVILFFEKYVDECEGEGGSGSMLTHEHFELTPRDFLEFAEIDLENNLENKYTLVNATSNLKRALDCQLDSFFVSLNLDSFYRKKKLGINKKLGFLEKSGLFKSRSLEKLNNIRNKLEHNYEIPKIQDVEIYYDLVMAFINVIESSLSLVAFNSKKEMTIKSGGIVSIKYSVNEPKIVIFLEHTKSNTIINYECNLYTDSREVVTTLNEFAFLFKLHMLFNKFDEGIFSKSQFIKYLKI